MGQTHKILIADSDFAFAKACQNHLENLGYAVVIAHAYAQAADELADPAISTVIVDGGLNGGGAIALMKMVALRPSSLGEGWPRFILTTADPTVELAIEALRASAVDLLIKPFAMAALDVPLALIREMRAKAARTESVDDKLSTLTGEIRLLGSLLQNQASHAAAPVDVPASMRTNPDAALLRKLIRAESTRAMAIGGKALGDPAWNILLDLILASLEDRKVAVSSACIVAGVATTTALRLITRMVDDGVLMRVPDESDGRRHFLAIEPTVERALKSYIADLADL
ncbi:response regulator [Sandarakinorhabdus limnophila]|jgi:DNA-binding response OmpR family regulator|uniref:response regulator n=1 Tax=Sandarakinorhabdus limnophila TaxID=210512 RepID=UPI0037CAD73E